MKGNNIINVRKVIYLLDKHIIELLSKKDFNYEKIESLSEIRSMYIGELNNFMRSKNTSEMFDKEYWKSYRKSNHY